MLPYRLRAHADYLRERFPNDLTNQVTRDGHDPVASGGFADIYQGVLQDNGRSTRVAIKAIKTYSGEDDRLSKKQKAKIKVWLNLKHDNVLPFLGTTMGFGRFPAMVCPWVENGTLTLYLENRYDSLSVIGVLGLLNNVASGLQYLHSCSVVHGDLSGSNVLIHESGRACITDFGLSMLLTELGASTFATSFHTRGTLRWAAPELLDIEIPVDDMHQESPRVTPVTQSDVYSFGSIMLQVGGIHSTLLSCALHTFIWCWTDSEWQVRWLRSVDGCSYNGVGLSRALRARMIVEFIEQELADCQSREIMMPVVPQSPTIVPTVASPHLPPDDPTSNTAQTSSMAALDCPVAPSALSRTASELRHEMSPSLDVHSTTPDLTPYIIKADDQYVARGDFGDVYRCWYHDGSPKEVAVKALRFGFATDGDHSKGFTNVVNLIDS
ncbi:kinase-like domain-containing protein [Boletus reticuloceps]|uniref:Kinase-like domain-containing protein n=1 Tax=Boletus reticuloceps TaxID=495285 RepID=A0A8I3AAI9_9AGAM|nr:kinase-like domain-containing protein [Boletus reticuloceps]